MIKTKIFPLKVYFSPKKP